MMIMMMKMERKTGEDYEKRGESRQKNTLRNYRKTNLETKIYTSREMLE